MLYIDFHTHSSSTNQNMLAIVNYSLTQQVNTSQNYASYGIHPWDTEKFNPELLNKLRSLASEQNVLTIGECGLDKLKGADLTAQTDIFIAHIKLSEKLKKPLVIHCVKAYSEIIKLRKDINPSQTWVFHGFNSSLETMQQGIMSGFYFSFGPTIQKSHSKAHQAFLNCPLDKLFLETDDSNENIENLYKYAAQERGISINSLSQQIAHNLNIIIKQYISI